MSFHKVLVYVEPWVEDSRPGWKQNYIWWFGEILKSLGAVSEQALEVVFVLGDDCALHWDAHRNCESTHAVITQRDLRRVFPDARSALVAWMSGDYSPSQIERMAELVKNSVGSFQPDVIFSITPCPFLEKLYPDALVLFRDAMYCREPWPDEMTCLDPIGINVNSVIGQFVGPLADQLPSSDQADFVDKIRSLFLSPLLECDPFVDLIAEYRTRYEKLVLLPLQSNGHYNFYSSTDFSSQYDYLIHVLDEVPPFIGVLVTQHPDDVTLSSDAVGYLRATYPNFIYIDLCEAYHSPSQFLIANVDGLVCVSSGICYQALLWDKPIFIVGKSHFSPLSESFSLSTLDKALAGYSGRSSALVAWLLSHYFFSYAYLKDGAWLCKYISEVKRRKENGQVGLDLFPRIDAFDNIVTQLAAGQRASVVLKAVRSETTALEVEVKDLKFHLEHEREAARHLRMVLEEKDSAIVGQHAVIKSMQDSFCFKLKRLFRSG